MYKYLSHTQFWLIISFFIVVAVFSVISIVMKISKSKYYKAVSFMGIIASFSLVIALFINSYLDTSYKYYTDIQDFWTNFGLYIFTALICLAIILFVLLCGKKQVVDVTREIAYAAITLALSFGLSYIKLFSLPKGGSVTLFSLLPIMIYSFAFGIRKGVLLGFIYGILQFIQEPWFYHPIQFMLDYPLAFSAIGLTGIFHELDVFKKFKKANTNTDANTSTEEVNITNDTSNLSNDEIKEQLHAKENNLTFTYIYSLEFVLGAILAVVLRYASHVISGIYVFGSGDPDNYGAVAWSFLYNSFAFADISFDVVLGAIVLSSNQLVKLIFSMKNKKK